MATIKRAFFLAGALISFYSLSAQTEAPIFPIVGKTCPDVTFHSIKYFNRTTGSIKEFRGKWLMLDIWEKNCGACIASFPRISHKRKTFVGKMEVIMVGVSVWPMGSQNNNAEEQRQTEDLFAKAVQKDTLDLPFAYDATLGTKWDIAGVPYVVIIDPKGIVRAITSSIREEKVDSLLKGFSPEIRYNPRSHEDIGPQARPTRDRTFYTEMQKSDPDTGPRFAFKNDNDFPVLINTYALNGGWDSIGPGQVGKFHPGDYRTCLQVFNVTYEMSKKDFRGKINALHYDPKLLTGPAPAGDWIVHYHFDGDWKVKAVKVNY